MDPNLTTYIYVPAPASGGVPAVPKRPEAQLGYVPIPRTYPLPPSFANPATYPSTQWQVGYPATQAAPVPLPLPVTALAPPKPIAATKPHQWEPAPEVKPPNLPPPPDKHIVPLYNSSGRPPPPAYPYPPPAEYHVCAECRRPRSKRYHREHPIVPGRVYRLSICRRCKDNKSSSGSDWEARRRLARLEKETYEVRMNVTEDDRRGRPRVSRHARSPSRSTSRVRVRIRSNEHRNELQSRQGERSRHRDRVIARERVSVSRSPPPRAHSLERPHARYHQDAEGRIASHPHAYRHGRMISMDHSASPSPDARNSVHTEHRRSSPSPPRLGYSDAPKQRVLIEDKSGPLHSAHALRTHSRQHPRGPPSHRSPAPPHSILRSLSWSRIARPQPGTRETRRSDESRMADVGGPRVAFADAPRRRGGSGGRYDGHYGAERWFDGDY